MRKVVMKDGENDFVGGIIFHKRVKRIIESMLEEKELLLDLNNYYLDSSVIGTLLAIRTTCMKGDISLKLKNISPETRKVLTITGVMSLLDVIEDEND